MHAHRCQIDQHHLYDNYARKNMGIIKEYRVTNILLLASGNTTVPSSRVVLFCLCS